VPFTQLHPFPFLTVPPSVSAHSPSHSDVSILFWAFRSAPPALPHALGSDAVVVALSALSADPILEVPLAMASAVPMTYSATPHLHVLMPEGPLPFAFVLAFTAMLASLRGSGDTGGQAIWPMSYSQMYHHALAPLLSPFWVLPNPFNG
jgi:hypothetical protein